VLRVAPPTLPKGDDGIADDDDMLAVDELRLEALY
jgi:hypothetical protein